MASDEQPSSISMSRLLRYAAITASIGIGGAALYYAGTDQGFNFYSAAGLPRAIAKAFGGGESSKSRLPVSRRVVGLSLSVVTLSSVALGASKLGYFDKGPVDRLREMIPDSLREAAHQLEGPFKLILDGLTHPSLSRHPLLLNLAVAARLQEDLRVVSQRPSLSPAGMSVCENREVSEAALHWMRFASCAYGFALCKTLGLSGDVSMHEVGRRAMAGKHEASVQEITDKLYTVKHAGLGGPEDIIFNDYHSPCFYIALDHEKRAVVLAVRGTLTVADAFTDLVCESTTFLSGEAHTGIAAGAKKVLKRSRDALVETLTRYSSEGHIYKLVITGHSLGAGTAILLTLLMSEDSALATHKIECWAFGPPPVFSPLERISPRCHNAIKCFVYRNDWVPRMSLHSVHTLCLQVKSVDMMPWTAMTRLKVAMGTRKLEDQENMELMGLFDQLRDSCRASAQPLTLPGQIYWMSEAEGHFQLTHSEKFGSVLLKSDMLMSHFPNNYEWGLQKTIAGLDSVSKL
mmetsp:Transcript_23061/g.38597  ORF Transcript_23061/g.38597 Transcript_23061/m.38597 type:complete len:518 (-) Transcript_23061:41-1594(-)|eukprot:CAMPEP_0198209832 /NCGR_PEP_ID=MMETSP1445-20131203/17760_1 /TAXON_ID=36898 /ORGANISM="Pyramimonas sp., Strain CCMP2087" /LENGTH=517 /DNA_ID=CAMNT_0043883729 /DNA_START=580 /DNA_END=2133 /DNA_ORIENTATION=+